MKCLVGLHAFVKSAAAIAALCFVSLASAELRIVPGDLVAGDTARAALQEPIEGDADVAWTLERIKPARSTDETNPLIAATGKGLAKVSPDTVGTWVVTARVMKANGEETVFVDSFVVRPVQVASPVAAASSSATESSAHKRLAAQAVADQQEVRSEYGLVEAVPADLISDQTLVDERDGLYLQSLDAVAGVFDEFAQKPEPAPEERQAFVEQTWEGVWVKLRAIHPAWAVYQTQYGQTMLGEAAWKNLETKLRKDTLNRILGELQNAGRLDDFQYTKAWKEIAAGFRAAKGAQEKWIEELKQANQTYQRYMNDSGGGGTGMNGYRGPRYCLELLLGL